MSAETSAVASVMPADGPSFGIAPSGHVNVHVGPLVEVLLDAEFLGLRAHVAHRRLRRLLHHVAELAGERQVPLARHQRRFRDQDLAADLGPRQPGRDADLVGLLGHRVAEARHAEVLR